MGLLQKNDIDAKKIPNSAIDFVYTICCHLGLSAIRKGKVVLRALSELGEVLKKAAKTLLKNTKKLLKRPLILLKKEVLSVLDFTFRAPLRFVRQTIKTARKHGLKEAIVQQVAFLHETRNVFFKNTLIVASYVLPVCAAIFLFNVINSNHADEYFVRVTYNGNVIGYVENEAVFYDGEALMRERIMYSEDETAYYFNPYFEMVRKDDEMQTSDPYMICNELIKNSGDVFSTAYGLYVDDVFYGATTEG